MIPTEWLGFLFGMADGDAKVKYAGFDTFYHDGADFFGYFQTEFRIKLPSNKGPLAGNYRFGMLYDPRTKTIFRDDLDGVLATRYAVGDVGWWLSFDQKLWRENDKDDQGLGAFLRYGWRHGDVNQLSRFYSGGLSYERFDSQPR